MVIFLVITVLNNIIKPKMLQIPDHVRQVLVTLVPAAVINEISCFKFYDNHPRDVKKLDVILCTLRGELKEYYNRELICSTIIEDCGSPSNIILYRNSKGDLFYIVAASNKLFIFTRKNTIQLIEQVNNVDTYELDDSSCNGQACLKIVYTYDAVPLYFDENFLTLDYGLRYSHTTDETLPILTELMTKLTEAKYSVICNENAYNELSSLRQIAAYYVYQKNMPDFQDSLFVDEKNVIQDQNSINIKTQKPWVKMCNKKIVIVVEILNTNEVPITDVQILLESDTKSSLTYTTKIFKCITESPFWCEQTQTINPNINTAVVAIIHQNELQYNVTSCIKFTGIISYKLEDNEQILPMDNIYISALDTMGEEFDVLSSITNDNSQIQINLLAVLATTIKTVLCIRHIQETAEDNVNIMDAFCRFLLMRRIPETNNIVIHTGSPCHILNGVMIVLQGSGEGVITARSTGTWICSVHARSPPQVLALIHCIHDAIPHRIVVTTTNFRLSARSQLYSHHNEDVSHITTPNYFEYGTSILTQTTDMLKYFDNCMMKMHESKNPVVQCKIGREIDVFVGGMKEFLGFRKDILDCGLKGVNSIVERPEGNEIVVVNVD